MGWAILGRNASGHPGSLAGLDTKAWRHLSLAQLKVSAVAATVVVFIKFGTRDLLQTTSEKFRFFTFPVAARIPLK
jgi:hypothetical protein